MYKIVPIVMYLLIVSQLFAESEPLSTVGFRGMEIHTFKRGTSRLRLSDLNADGRKDIIFLNQMASRMEVLLRRGLFKEEEDLPELKKVFDSQGVILDQQVLDFSVVDLLVGKPGLDILTYGRTLGIQRFEVATNGVIGAAINVFVKGVDSILGMKTGDFDSNGAMDIAVFRSSGVEILWNDDKTLSFARRTTLDIADNRFLRGDIADVNADGNVDLLFFMKPPGDSMIVRLGDGKGGFGLELPLDFRTGALANSIAGRDGSPSFLSVPFESGVGVRLYRYISAVTDSLFSKKEIRSARAPLRGIGKGAPCYMVSDVDHDGYDDLFVAAPELSRLYLYRGCADGLRLPAEVIDTCADVVSISPAANGDIMVVSRSEKVAALHTAGDLTAFPSVIDVEGDLLAGVAVGGSAMLLTRDPESGKYTLVMRDLTVEKGKPPVIIEVPDLLNDPESMQSFDMGDAGIGILLYVPYEKPVMYLLRDGALTSVTTSQFRALSLSLTPGQISVENGRNGLHLTVCSGQIARTYGWNGDRFDVVRQLNPGDKQANIVAASSFRGPNSEPGTLLFDSGGRNLLWFKDGAVDPLNIHIRTETGVVTSIVPLRAKDKISLVLLSRDSLHILAEGIDTLALESCADYISPTEDARIYIGVELEMGLPRLTLGFVDMAHRTIEIGERVNGAIKNLLTFKVFDSSAFVGDGRSGHEPHGMVAGDIDGDGISDLTVLAQDRLLIYFGE